MKRLYFTLVFLIFTKSLLFSKDYNILTFGAIPDGKTLNTTVIQSAINQANKDGGGRVIIPTGNFLSGSIILKSGVELHLTKKATLLGSTKAEDYLKINRWKGLIMADNASDIAISGKGTINGQGAQLAMHIDSLFYIHKIDSIHYNFIEKRPKYYLRPQIIEIVNCENIKVTGVTIRNAACWVQTYDLCKNLLIDRIRVESDTYWNNDGIDIVDCKNVRITNSTINSADDGICLKSSIANNRTGTNYHGTNFCDSIYIENCTIRSSASAIKLGARSVGGFKNITIKNIKVFDTFRSAIALESVDGGILENILIDNIRAINTGNAIFIRLGHRIPSRDKGKLNNIVIKNVFAKIAFEKPDYAYTIRGPELPFFHNIFPSSITGVPGAPIENIQLDNIKIIYPGRGNSAFANMPLSRVKDVPEQEINYPEFSMFGELPAWGFYIRHVDGLKMNNIKIKIKKPDYRPAFVIDDVRNSNLQSIYIGGDKKPEPFFLHQVENVKIIE